MHPNAAEMPPLGNPPDFEQMDRERSARLLAFDHIPASEFPEAELAVRETARMIDRLRHLHGVPALTIQSRNVRFIDKSLWKQFVATCATVTEDFGAFYDPKTGICFLAFDFDAYRNSRLERIKLISTICHELGHKCFPSLEKYSFHLSEGLADFIAREAMKQSTLLTREDRTIPSRYLKMVQEQGHSPEVGGFVLKADDIIAILEDGLIKPTGYTRIPQIRLINKLQSSNPEAFKKILTLAFTGDIDGVNQVIIETCGEDVAESIQDKNANLHFLISLIDERHQLGQFLDK